VQVAIAPVPQHGWPAAPHVWQVPFMPPEHPSDGSEHVSPAQHGCPDAPHIPHVPPAAHASPLLHISPAQHAWPAAPHCAHVPALHASPAPVQVSAQQG
jgi:hypothetical protein